MKMRKRLSALLLGLMAALLLLPGQALAAGSIETDRAVSLTISYQDQGTPLTGARFDIYLVATVDAYGELTATDTFRDYPVNIRGKNDDAWRNLASTLEAYILRDSVAPTDSGRTGKDGLLTFPTEEKTLEQGLYLVLGQRLSQGGYRYEAKPFMVLLPALDWDNNDWTYDVTAEPKHDAKWQPSGGGGTVTRKVLKVWADEGHEKERPKAVVVQLLRNGKVWDTVTLNAANNWRHTWAELSDDYTWTLAEQELEGYTVEVTREGVTFVVTNSYDEDIPDEPPPEGPPPETPDEPDGPDIPEEPVPTGPKLPQTGQLWWPVPALTAGGLLLIVLGLLRRRGGGDAR